MAALVAAVPYLDPADAAYAVELADCWNERIEDWTYVRETELCQRFGVDGCYVRIGPSAAEGGLRGCVEVHNRPGDVIPAEALVGLEFIYLARLGLRSADDRRILDSLKVADALLRTDTPCGPVYHRYNGDGYGEHEDGSPYDGTGVGRGWPLLVGERGHLALMRGEDTLPYLEAMACMTGRCGLLPEQVWDSDPVPRFGLTPGKPSGSVMPLVWAHAEFLKLLVAKEHRRPVELLEAVWQRYEGKRPAATTWYWRSEAPFEMLQADRSLVIEDSQPFVLHVGRDGWQKVHDRPSQPLGLGMHGVRLDRADLTPSGRLSFTRFYPRQNRWEGADHAIELGVQPSPAERDLAPAPRHLVRRNRRSR